MNLLETLQTIGAGIAALILVVGLVALHELWSLRRELKPLHGMQWWWRSRL